MPRVLVTDADVLSALAACRALRAAGYEVAAAANHGLALGFWSRTCAERIRLPDPRDDTDTYIGALARVLRQKRYDVLIPGSEASLLPISEHREVIEHAARLGLPPHADVLRSLSKSALLAVAEASGLAPPPTRVCASLSEALAAVADLDYPVVVKPERSFVEQARGLRQGEVCVASNDSSLAQALKRAGTPILLQHYVTNPRIFFCSAVSANQQLLGFSFARIQRTWPPHAGSASMAVSVTPPKGIETRVHDLISRISWQGIFQLQFLQLDEDRFALIDFNPRLYASMALSVRAGANLPALWCDHLLGRDRQWSGSPIVGVYFRREDFELRHAAKLIRSGHVRNGLSLLRPHRPAVHSYFQMADPAPALARSLQLVKAIAFRVSNGRADRRGGEDPHRSVGPWSSDRN
jgi:predicted ATP-grasp superfamily ATP-dependent carboligase